MLITSYLTVPSAIWQIIYLFLISCDLVHEPLGGVKGVQIRSFFCSVFSCILSEYRKNADQEKLRIWTLFAQCLGEWNNTKIWKTREIFVIIISMKK